MLSAGDKPADKTRTADALHEAFGDDRWSTLTRGAVLARLEQARPPAGPSGARRPRYAALSRGGVLECVMALGHDDAADGPRPGRGGPDALGRVHALGEALHSRGYVEGDAAAAALLARVGRSCGRDPATRYFSHADGLAVAPLAGPPSTRGVVVRVVANVDGRSGDAAAAAFVDGLCNAALSMYVGHWRYGLGADFDRAIPLEVRDRELPPEPRRLAGVAKAESRRRDEPFETVLDRWRDEGRIVIPSSAARVALGGENLARENPAARLVHWVARAAEGGPPEDVVGIAAAAGGPAHRIWMLLSCRSAAAFPRIRRVIDASALRLVGLHGLSSLSNWRSLPWVLDALRAGGAWSELVGAVDQRANPDGVVVEGWEEDPLIP